MTEAEWASCSDARPMLDHLLELQSSNRKMRLFCCACCRAVWPALADERSRRALEVTEGYAEGLATEPELRRAMQEACKAAAESIEAASGLGGDARALQLQCAAAEMAFGLAADRAGWFYVLKVAYGARAATDLPAFLRDVFGNPFRPAPALNPAWLAWRGGVVRELAGAAYDGRRLPEGTLEPERLGELADALEDAGCGDAELLGHLRGPGPHVRGCWALDLVLGKA